MVSDKQQGAPKLNDQTLWRTTSLVNGEWLESTPTTFSVTDPGTNKVISQCSDHGAEETEAAIKAAHEAYKKWSIQTGKHRGDILAKVRDLCIENIDDLATIISMENGKSLAEAKVECNMSIGQLDWMAAEAQRNYGDLIPSPLPGVRNMVIKQAVGVAGIITPWNFPQSMIVRKVAAAFAAGAACVIKAPRETPHSALAFGVLAERAGLPRGLYNVITTNRSSLVGRILCENPLVRKISFTGSTPVGKILMSQAASTLSKCSFELGGNAPFIVFDDADLDKAVEAAAGVKFRCSGQVCIAANRLLVQSGIHDKFVDALVKKVQTFKVGYGLDDDTTHGPLINEKAVEKTVEHVEDATAKGAVLAVGGKRLGGNFYAPTVLTKASKDMLISDDETFGPVAAIYKFETEEEAVALSNDTEYGLAGYFFSRDMGRIFRVSEALEVGMVGVNGASVSQASAPFGGVKQSGYGREGSKYGMEEFTSIKLVAINTA